MEINFIPIENYTPIYYHVLLVITLIAFFYTLVYKINDKENLIFLKFFGPSVLLFVLLYMGFRPINIVFRDMIVYNNQFEYYASGFPITSIKDVFFHLFMKFCASIMTANVFFFTSAVLYTLPLYIATKKWFKEYWFYAFLMLIGSLSFWGFGTNGIRNGIATSFFILAISRDKILFKILIILIAIGFHKSLLLPAMAYIVTLFYKKTNVYITFWLFAIPTSLVLGSTLESFLATFIEDDRASYLTDGNGINSAGSFRWDFLLYSAFGVYAGWFYIIKKKFSDVLYSHLFNVYLICNTIWILVIRAAFTNRFAYLSWFLLAIIIIYPLLKKRMLKNQLHKIGIIFILYISFTYALEIFMKSNG